MKTLTLTSKLKLQASDGGKPRRFSILAYAGGPLNVSGFPMPVVVDLAGLEIPGNVPILIDHRKEVEATLGLVDAATNDGQSLMLQGAVTGASPLVQSVIQQAAAGHEWQASIGAQTLEEIEVKEGQTVTVNGQQQTGPFILATKSILRETSVLPMGADRSTRVNLAAAAAAVTGAAAVSFEDWLKGLGLSIDSMTPEQQQGLMKAWEAMSKPNAPPPVAAAEPPMDPEKKDMSATPATTAAAAAEVNLNAAAELSRTLAAVHRRQAEITAKAAGHHDIIAAALEHNWSADKVELEVLKRQQTRTRPTSFTASHASVDQSRMLQAALSTARGHKRIEGEYTDAELQAAHTQFRGRIGIQQIMLMAAAANGMPISPGTRIDAGNLREVLQYGYGVGHMVQAAFSTVSLPGIFSNLANKELLTGFEEEDNNWDEISDIKPVSDFKTHTSYRLLDDMEYEELGPGGLIKHGKLGEESYTRSADTYAKMFSLTRRDIINDDLGAFDDLRQRLGRGAARRLNRLVWTTFLANHTTFWTTARTNYIEGATTNLGLDGVGLSAGVKAFRQRKSPLVTGAEESSRMTLGGRATKLLVPPELEANAEALYVARNLNAVKASDANIHAGKYRVVVASELSDSAYGGGYSTTAWYLFGDTLKPVVTSFLNGQRSPTVESADADFNTLGIQFRGYHDFGCSQSEYLSGVKSKGAA
jgi:hypothetical protein